MSGSQWYPDGDQAVKHRRYSAVGHLKGRLSGSAYSISAVRGYMFLDGFPVRNMAYESLLGVKFVSSLLDTSGFLPESSDFLCSGLKGRTQPYTNSVSFTAYLDECSCFSCFNIQYSGLIKRRF